ncbi:MAG: YifB family Mg chelatase-like AAA ATPase [Candidatus Bipolaricaulota bacterium]
MFAKTVSATPYGVEARLVEVQCDSGAGYPSFSIVGLAEKEVSEARERVRSALRNAGLRLPEGKITANLAPADLRKEGAGLDLALAVALLAAAGMVPPASAERYAYHGELGLDGSLRSVRGVLAVALAVDKAAVGEMIVPRESAAEAALVEGLTVYPASTLEDVVRFLRGEEELEPEQRKVPPADPPPSVVDLSVVRGQEHARRALEIAAAGGHNLLFVGPPGAGKSLLARCFPGVLPELLLEEALEVSRIHSVAGLLSPERPLMRWRPFRDPHHTISYAGMVGGGRGVPVPGEVTLAHRGVLFLDELPEFPRRVLEALRQPLEEGWINVTRSGVNVTFPASVILAGAMNPCPCGHLGDPIRECRCRPHEVEQYRKRLSGPFLDRMDLFVPVPRLTREELLGEGEAEPSQAVRARVAAARRRQAERLGGEGRTNAHLGPGTVRKECKLTREARQLLERAVDHFGLTGRGYARTLKVARTVADLDGAETIDAQHLAEALQYRASEEAGVHR